MVGCEPVLVGDENVLRSHQKRAQKGHTMENRGEHHQTQTEQIVVGFHQGVCAVVGRGLHLLPLTGSFVATVNNREKTVHAAHHRDGGQQIKVPSKFLSIGLVVEQKFGVIPCLVGEQVTINNKQTTTWNSLRPVVDIE